MSTIVATRHVFQSVTDASWVTSCPADFGMMLRTLRNTVGYVPSAWIRDALAPAHDRLQAELLGVATSLRLRDVAVLASDGMLWPGADAAVAAAVVAAKGGKWASRFGQWELFATALASRRVSCVADDALGLRITSPSSSTANSCNRAPIEASGIEGPNTPLPRAMNGLLRDLTVAEVQGASYGTRLNLARWCRGALPPAVEVHLELLSARGDGRRREKRGIRDRRAAITRFLAAHDAFTFCATAPELDAGGTSKCVSVALRQATTVEAFLAAAESVDLDLTAHVTWADSLAYAFSRQTPLIVDRASSLSAAVNRLLMAVRLQQLQGAESAETVEPALVLEGALRRAFASYDCAAAVNELTSIRNESAVRPWHATQILKLIDGSRPVAALLHETLLTVSAHLIGLLAAAHASGAMPAAEWDAFSAAVALAACARHDAVRQAAGDGLLDALDCSFKRLL
jgi:hypothetical protein